MTKPKNQVINFDLELPNLAEGVGQALRSFNGIVLKHHHVSVVPAGLGLPELAQLELQFRVAVVPVVALGFQRDDLARLGLDDEVWVVVEKAVDAEAFAPRQIAVPPHHAVEVSDVVDQPPLEVAHGRLGHVQAFGHCIGVGARRDRLGQLEPWLNDDAVNVQHVGEGLQRVSVGKR